jgi:hypothetical protein
MKRTAFFYERRLAERMQAGKKPQRPAESLHGGDLPLLRWGQSVLAVRAPNVRGTATRRSCVEWAWTWRNQLDSGFRLYLSQFGALLQLSPMGSR